MINAAEELLEPGQEGRTLEGAHTWRSQPALYVCVC